MNGNIRVGNLFGIPFYVNPSWFFVLAIVTWTYSSGLATQFSGLPAGAAWLLGFTTALLLFASVLAHELGHSFVALRQGIRVQSITLFLFGGLASLEKESDTPAAAFWVAIAGPLVSLCLAGIMALASFGVSGTGPIAAVLSVLMSVNLALALFNLIPGLPLDGGNILKALVWKLTGNPYTGVKFASRVGQLFGWVAVLSGLLPIVLFGSFANIWNLLIGGFLLQNAGRSAQFAKVQERLNGLTAADAITPDSPIVAAESSLRDFADELVLSRNRWQKFLVIDAEGQLVGEIAVDALRTIPSDRWSDSNVSELVRPIVSLQTISAHQPLLEVIKLLEEKQLSALTVLRENGRLLGILEKSAILNLLQRQTQATPA